MEPSIIVVAEHCEGHIRPVTYELIACAAKIQRIRPLAIGVVILGDEISSLAGEIAATSGQDVCAVQVTGITGYNGELYREILGKLVSEWPAAYLIAAHTAQGLDYAPALAAALHANCITGVEDVFEKDRRLCVTRSLYGGKIVAHLRPETKLSILCIQPAIFNPLESFPGGGGTVEIKAMTCHPRTSVSLGLKHAAADRTDISEANVIVAAGRGIGEEANLDLIYQLASLFPRSAVAGSRIICDLGWLAYKCQVGTTGATVNPALYIACGISGAAQHVIGMRGSGFIVAINQDAAAAIFRVADVCIVEDLKTFIPTLIETYKAGKRADNGG